MKPHTHIYINILILYLLGMSSAEVTRYFISSLQLANTDNIEICGARPGQLSNESFEIRLLHRDRYHERLTEYQAPSKESLKERLTRLKNRKKVNGILSYF